jgi:hypothetical protein
VVAAAAVVVVAVAGEVNVQMVAAEEKMAIMVSARSESSERDRRTTLPRLRVLGMAITMARRKGVMADV